MDCGFWGNSTTTWTEFCHFFDPLPTSSCQQSYWMPLKPTIHHLTLQKYNFDLLRFDKMPFYGAWNHHSNSVCQMLAAKQFTLEWNTLCFNMFLICHLEYTYLSRCILKVHEQSENKRVLEFFIIYQVKMV